MKNVSLFVFLILLLASCMPTPHDVQETSETLVLYPDYKDITVPVNIAPLNFLLRNEQVDALQVRMQGRSQSLECNFKGRKAIFDIQDWKAFLQKVQGEELTVTVTARVEGKWLQYPAFHWMVAQEPVDAYVSYRLIEPGFEVWNKIQIQERCMENFETRTLAHHSQLNNQCMNCHIHGGAQGEYSLFHLRGENGGTLLNRGGGLRKVALRNEQMDGGAVYGDFHPTGRFAVFSTNEIIPSLHTMDNKRLEVYDTKSDLCIADFEQNRMILSPLVADTTSLETFPAFSADGKYVYYCGAPQIHQPDSTKQLQYSLCRILFDAEKGEWGTEVDTLWNAREKGGSVNFPKASPDGKYLLFTRSDYGTFPIWHREADLCMVNLHTLEEVDMSKVNSDRSDTYHTWSRNSRWIAFASKRGDGQYGRVYLAYLDSQGKAHRAFVLPQEDPEMDDLCLKSYNIPDLSAVPMPYSSDDVSKAFKVLKPEKFD